MGSNTEAPWSDLDPMCHINCFNIYIYIYVYIYIRINIMGVNCQRIPVILSHCRAYSDPLPNGWLPTPSETPQPRAPHCSLLAATPADISTMNPINLTTSRIKSKEIRNKTFGNRVKSCLIPGTPDAPAFQWLNPTLPYDLSHSVTPGGPPNTKEKYQILSSEYLTRLGRNSSW